MIKKMVALGPIVSGAIAGLLANFIGRLLWRVVRRPELEFKGVRRSQPMDDSAEPWTTYQIQVSNTGGQVARNSKPELDLSGKLEATHVGRDRMTEEHDISISTALCWSESEHPTRININPDETAAFELMRVREDKGIVQFPSEDGWEYYPSLNLRYNASSVEENASFHQEGELAVPIDTEDLRRTEWQTRSVQVTAENISNAITNSITITWNGSSLPAVVLSDG